jgi:hypothetical protein
MRLTDGGGRFIPHIFNEKQATAAELRELKARMRDIKRITRDCLLLAIPNAELRRGVTWDERWQKWNQRFPDFAFLTPGAFRKACGYAFKPAFPRSTRRAELEGDWLRADTVRIEG